MIFGNKNQIAFVVGDKVNNTHIELNVFVDGIDQHQLDNNHLLPMSVYNIESEMDFINKDLSLKDEFASKSINELFDLFSYFNNYMYKSGVATKNIFGYDISTSIGFFFTYQEEDDLIIFGRAGNAEMLSVKIKKINYLKILDDVLSVLRCYVNNDDR